MGTILETRLEYVVPLLLAMDNDDVRYVGRNFIFYDINLNLVESSAQRILKTDKTRLIVDKDDILELMESDPL